MHRKAPFVALVLALAVASLWPASAQAQHRRAVRSVVVVGGFVYNPFLYDPFFAPFPWYQYPYPGSYYGGVYRRDSSLRVVVQPRDAEVYVDGYYAGTVDDFDGIFQRLHVPPGDHEVTLYREGYRSLHRKVYLAPDSTFKLTYDMEKLAAGDMAEPRPVAPVPPPPPQMAPRDMPPRRIPPRGIPPQQMPPRPMPPPTAGAASRFGTIAIRVQPADAEVLIDGERWHGSSVPDERLLVQVAEGAHRVEVHKEGYEPFSTDVQVRRGETASLNVSLPAGR